MMTPKKSGTRRYDAAHARARQLAERFEGTELPRSKIARTAERAGRIMGVSAEALALLDTMFATSQDKDWMPGAPHGPIVWPSNLNLAEEFQVTERAIQLRIDALIRHGLVAPVDSPNGRRYGRRRPDGHIDVAYGFSLAPCAVLHDVMRDVIAARDQELAERRDLDKAITQDRRMVTAIAEQAEAGRAMFEELAAEVAAWMARKKGATIELRRTIASELRRIRELAEERFAQLAGLAEQARKVVTKEHPSPTDEPRFTHTTTTAHPSIPSESCGFRAKEEWSTPQAFGPAPEIVAMEDLEHFKVTPGHVLRLGVAPRFTAGWGAEATWPDVVEEAYCQAEDRGLNGQVRRDLTRVVGERAASVAILLTYAKHDRGLVRNPGGYLRRMAQRGVAGDLRLGASVWGILKGQDGSQDAPERRQLVSLAT